MKFGQITFTRSCVNILRPVNKRFQPVEENHVEGKVAFRQFTLA
jgi:hypothetical protein